MTGAMLQNVRPGWCHRTARQRGVGNRTRGEADRLAGHPVSALPRKPADRHGQSVRRARAAGKTAPDALARALRKARISQFSIGFLYQHTAALGFTTLPLLPLIRQRTLVLTGDEDPIILVANGRILAAGIPHAKLHVYHGGHIELVTRPSLFTPLITGFLAAPPHDARRAEQVQAGRHPEDQGPRQVAGGTAA